MSISKKPRADSKLKTLPPPRQADIFARLALPAKEGGGYLRTQAWLLDEGIEVSLGELSEFYSWHCLEQQMSRNERTVERLLKRFKQMKPPASSAEVQAVGQAFFSALALEQQNPRVWALTQQLGLKREQLDLARQKFEFDAARECLKRLPELKAISAKPSLSPEEKARAIQQILFPKPQ